MHNKLISAVIFFSLCFTCACQNKPAETTPARDPEPPTQTEQKPAADEPSQPRAAPEQPATAPSKGTAAPEQGKAKGPAASPASSERRAEGQASPSAQSGSATPQKPALSDAKKAPVQPIILTGAPMGGVRFEHGRHPIACETCHHAPRDPKRGSTDIGACTSCHTKPPQPGMKTGKQAAFHNASATAGTCIDCHKKSGAAAPTKCAQCHKRENA